MIPCLSNTRPKTSRTVPPFFAGEVLRHDRTQCAVQFVRDFFGNAAFAGSRYHAASDAVAGSRQNAASETANGAPPPSWAYECLWRMSKNG
jgi:hypothetical protein